jgi:hypothetical protein
MVQLFAFEHSIVSDLTTQVVIWNISIGMVFTRMSQNLWLESGSAEERRAYSRCAQGDSASYELEGGRN